MAEKNNNQSSALYDYLNWRGDIGFDVLPLGEVDNLIFSIISYINFDGIIEGELSAKRPLVLLSATKSFLRSQEGTVKSLGLIIPKETVTLLVRAAKTPRFGLSRPICYVNKICDEEQKQFCALSFLLPGGGTFVSYRGTDDTLVGWKENFNMSFMHPVPAQTEALEYLEYIASKTSGKLYVGGHSKGGNLAVFASVKASAATKERIVAVYNNDGPGFDEGFIATDEYKEIQERIHTLVPQSSVVGMLLEHEERYKVVKSNTTGLWQHNGFSWEVMGGSFIKLDETDMESKTIDRALKAWVASLSYEKREQFVDSLYEALTSTNAKTLSELNSDKLKLIKAWNSMDSETRSNLIRCVNLIFGKKAAKQMKLTDNGE